MAFIYKVREIAKRNADRYPGRLRDGTACIPPHSSVTGPEKCFLGREWEKDTLDLALILSETSMEDPNPVFSTENEAICYTIRHSDPRWTTVLLPTVAERLPYREQVLPVLNSKICGEKTQARRVIAKCVYGFHEEFVGLLLNPLIEKKAPAFVYTFGNKPWDNTEAEAINSVPSFSRAERYTGSHIEGTYILPESTQLLTEYIRDAESLVSWLKEPRIEAEITFILLQIISNLLVANKHISFVHGDLHCGNVLIRKTERSFLPINGKVVAYDFPYEAKIIDYGLSTFSHKGKIYVGDTGALTNHESLWTDFFKILFCCWHYSEVNRQVLDNIALQFLNLIEELEPYCKATEPFFVLPPHNDIYKGLPDIEFVVSEMLAEVNSTYEVVEAPAISDFVTITDLAKVALRIREDNSLLSYYINSYVEVFYTFLDFVDKSETFKESYRLFMNPLKKTVLFLIGLLAENTHASAYKEEQEKMLRDYREMKKKWMQEQ